MISFVFRNLTLLIFFSVSFPSSAATDFCRITLMVQPTPVTNLAKKEVLLALSLKKDPIYVAFYSNPAPESQQVSLERARILLTNSKSIDAAGVASKKIHELTQLRDSITQLTSPLLSTTSLMQVIEDSIEAYKSLSLAQQYLVKRISRVIQILEAIPSFRDNTTTVAAAKPIYYRLMDLANTVMSFKSNINWESTSRDERLLRALNNDVQYELAQEYSSAKNFEQAQIKSDLNGYIGGRAYGLTFDIYLRASLREDPRLIGSRSFSQPDSWYSKNIDRIEQNLLNSLGGLVEALERANLAFAAP